MIHVGELIRQRRESLGASVEEAAQWAEIPPERLREAEASAQLGSTLFERICRGLAAAPGELLRGALDSPTRSVARFRGAAERTLSPSDLRLLAAGAEVGRALAAFLELLGREIPFERHRQVSGVREDMAPWEDGYRLGEAAREALGVPLGPLRDLERFLNGLGIHVARVPFQSRELEAASLWEDGAVPVILVNEKTGRAGYSLSRRATLAHELCHLLHDGGKADIATRVSLSEDCETREYAVEQRAWAFAPAFLAPPEMVRQWVRALPSLSGRELAVETASHWGLSYEGAVWHLENCGLVDPGKAEALSTRSVPYLPADQFEAEAAMVSPRMLDERLPENASALMDGWAAYLVYEALAAELISVGRAREMLEWGWGKPRRRLAPLKGKARCVIRDDFKMDDEEFLSS